MSYEVVNNKDKSRMSRAVRKGSTTVFDTIQEAKEWMASVGLSLTEYAILPAIE